MPKELQQGRYVIAVSGGVDSVALLHMLHAQKGLDLIVAHYDHGIRPDSVQDRQLVEALAAHYNLPFFYETGRLGKTTSEEVARDARYAFLRNVKSDQAAQAIITAHHQDDLLETIIHNISRGTGRLGLSPMHVSPDIVRPLIDTPKNELVSYAKKHGLQWHEDSTNQDQAYQRNYIRLSVLPEIAAADKQRLLMHAQKAHELNTEIDELLQAYLAANQTPHGLKRHDFIMLPHAVSREVMAAWLRMNGTHNFDKKAIERLTHAAKSYQAGKQADINGVYILEVKKAYLALVRLER